MSNNKKDAEKDSQVFLSVTDIKNLINLVEIEKRRIDSTIKNDPFLVQNKIYSIMYLEMINDKLRKGLK